MLLICGMFMITNDANLSLVQPSSTAFSPPGLLDHLRGTSGVVVVFLVVHMNRIS